MRMVRYTRILTTYWIVQTLSGRGDGGTPRTAVVSLPGSSEHRSNHRDANSKVFPVLGRILIVGLFCWRSPPANRNGRTISSEAPAPKHRSISLEERAGDCRRPARRRGDWSINGVGFASGAAAGKQRRRKPREEPAGGRFERLELLSGRSAGGSV